MTKTDHPPTSRTGVFRVLTLLYGAIGLVNALMADFLSAGTWLSLAAGMLALGNEATPWAGLPLWRRALAVVFVTGAVVLIGVRLAGGFLR